ncbi:uncharacterized protein LOC124122193 [Haliotis rufescens]|uniref:uncharacterized protein LOC124122193 n=1 Tax=Haliotis rufescens TaxID=6454 RepID=UPI00201FAA2B|nr:uncharacterized protein LOC124122193 [Haliotis rufescens]
MKLKAKKAALLAKADMLERQQSLKRQQAEIQLAQEKLELECEIHATEAEEKVYEDFEAELTQGSHIHKREGPLKGFQNKTFDQRHTSLNPLAGTWINKAPADNMHHSSGISGHVHTNDENFQSHQSDSNVWLMQQKILEVVQLPKSELIKFDGDPLRYWMFIRSFETNVAQTSVSSGAKLNRLLNYCTGKALSVIECCSVMDPDEGYMEALSLLKTRFGREHVIANAWVKKISEGPWLRPTDVEGLRNYADDLRSGMLTLKAMGKVNEVDNQIRMVKIVSRLPTYLQGRWRRKAVEHLEATGDYPGIGQLVDFVLRAAEEANDPIFGVVSGNRLKDDTTQNRPRSFEKKGVNYSVQTSVYNKHSSDSFSGFPIPNCPLCSGEHALFMCGKFRDLKPEKRHEFVVEKRLCFNCFSNNHMSRDCHKPSKCQVQGCMRKHSRLIHLLAKPETDVHQTYLKERNLSSTVPKQDKPLRVESSACNVVTQGPRVALPVVRLQVSVKTGNRKIWTYALLDSGSTNSFCSNELFDELGVDVSETSLLLTTLEKVNSTTSTRVGSLLITDAGNRTTIELSHVFGTINLSICACDSVKQQNVDEWQHLKGMDFPKVDRVHVGLIIGQDVPVALTPIDVRKGNDNEPYAVKTVLGWVLNGPLRVVRNGEVISHFVDIDQRLDAQVERFWKIERCESLSNSTCEMSQDDKRTIEIWDESAEVVDGHYEIKIPFRSRPPNVENNYIVAESRLESLCKRLSKDDKLFEKYQSGIKELIDKGYAEKVKEQDINKPGKGVWYIPHHAVINERKPDKLRIVFDCAAKYCGTSLNDQVYQGPDLTNKLIGVLLRFREGPIGIMGDIEGMFHQVKVPECDRDYLRFLWFSEGGNNQPEVYRMTVHLFGGVWSPSCASYALRRTAEDNSATYEPKVVQTVLENFYVDDCLKSLMSEIETIEHVQNLCSLVSHGGFKLNKWISNSREVLRSIPEEQTAKGVKGVDLIGGTLPKERALGVLWDTENDVFGFRITIKNKPDTRRGLMSVIASVYDPLGFVSPYILQAKKVFQSETRLHKGWDELLNQTNSVKWTKWVEDLPKLENFKLSRCVITQASEDGSYELHHFSDASCEGYGAVSYLRVVNNDGPVQCFLLISKSRLAPLKQMTIPRLELSAAVISVKLDVMLRQELKMEISRSVFWTDSTIVIQYIRNENKRFHVFIANRIALIRESSEPNQWRHVGSTENPADDVSRGLDADKMVSSDRWKHGPEFLFQAESEWPTSTNLSLEIPDGDKEVKKATTTYTTVTNGCRDLLFDLFEKYSTWHSLKRAVAWILRLKGILYNRTHKKKQSKMLDSVLSVLELKNAETAIVQVLQRKTYEQELKALEAGKPIARSSTIYRLEPMFSPMGVLCVGGRLRAAPVPVESKHNMILPRDSHVTTLIVRHYHEVCGHSGKEYVLSLIRQRFWIPKGRKLVSKLLNSCVDCKRRQKSPNNQRMADLPRDRVSPGDPAFTSVVLDCFGLFMVKRGRSEVKRYGCIFTCLTTRSIHLEKLDGLDTDSFLNGFVRFISRRGCPKTVRSDNGTNFRGAEIELTRAIDAWNLKRIGEFMSKKEICWMFNPPAASHMGGAWERLIRTVRKVMNALLRTNRPLDDDGLHTLFSEIESIVNGRPITVVSDDHKDAEPLTPNHLLLLRAGPDLPLGSFQAADAYRRRWKHAQFLADIFWKRWTKEYMPSLQLRQKCLLPKRNIMVGDIVLILNENCLRRSWPLARVVETYPGKDGLVRSVMVRTGGSTLTRPVDKLCLLEGVHE